MKSPIFDEVPPAAYYFRCVADDGCVGYGSVPMNYERAHILVVTEKGVSYVELDKVTRIPKEERDAGLRECYASPAWRTTPMSAGF